ncbi:non-specific lipid-transfer protein 2P-like [Ipomoea triloba]|uniref:non-specific lipid-transfer protein 2P-like n=1 Tax=Ipomoea triloba TaxID=35885 RepID=UPI00125D8913|nr:non-specific lipid-transfer protein 2P-like [Ipomoea triloba]
MTTLVVVFIMVTAMLELSMAQETCDVSDLSPCGPAVMIRSDPTTECCSILKELRPKCFCEYLKNPVYQMYEHNARQVFKDCGLHAPTC